MMLVSGGLPPRMLAMCVPPHATLREVLGAIEAGGQEICFVVGESERVIGMVTDGDVRRGILAGHDLDEATVGQITLPSFHSVDLGGNHRADALDLMKAHYIQQVPVLDEAGRLSGMHVIGEYIDRSPLPNWAVILAGGRGTRLGELTERVPKPMIRVAGRPILERLVLALVSAGIRKVFLSVNYKREIIQDYFGDGSNHGCDIRYLEESRQLGTGGPLRLLPEQPTHPIIHMNGDLVGEFRFRDLLEFHASGAHAMSMGVGLHRYVVPYGVVERHQDRVTAVHEKPAQHWWINYGVYAVSPDVLPFVPPEQEYPVTELMRTCLEKGLSVGAFELDGEWRDVGRPEDIVAARGGQSPNF